MSKSQQSIRLYQLLLHDRINRSGLILLSLVVILLGHTPTYAANIDSLKQVLSKTPDSSSEKCALGHAIFEHYVEGENLDSITQYGLASINLCDVNHKDEVKVINEVLKSLTQRGQKDVVDQEADALANQISDINQRLIFYLSVAENKIMYDPDADSNPCWDKANELLPHATDDNALCNYYNISGLKNQCIGNYVSAFQSCKIASTFINVEQHNKFKTRFILANNYISIGDYENSKELLTDLAQDAADNDDIKTLLLSSFGLMFIYSAQADNEAAIALGHRTLDIHEKHNYSKLKGYTYYILGESNLAISNLDSAYHYFNKGIEVSIENNEIKEKVDNYVGLGNYYKTTGDFENSKRYYQQALETDTYIKEYLDGELKREISELWLLQGECDKAYKGLENYINGQGTKQTQYESDIKLASEIIEDAYNYKQNTELKVKEDRKKQERLRLTAMIALIILALASFFLYYLYRNRLKLKALNDQISAHNSAISTHNDEISSRNNELAILTNKQNETIKYLENFAYVAAHDLKAPIRTASTFSEILAKSSAGNLDQKGLTLLNYIDSSVGKLSKMIDDLLSLSKIDVDLPEKEEVDLNKVVEDVKISLNSLMSESKSKIHIASELPTVNGHESLLAQLFQNIIKNAIIHNKSESESIIEISSKPQDNKWVMVSVADNSGGIPEYIMPKLFDLFASSNKNKGNGIGLAICKKIITHYGGEIWVDVKEGVGSTFYFTLPILN